MTTIDQFESLMGSTAVDAEGQKIGKVGQVYVSDETGQPEWVTLNTGLFGTSESFAPLYNSRIDGSQLVLAVSKQLVKDAPHPDLGAAGHLPEDEVDALYQHYSGYLAAGQGTTGRGVAGEDEVSGRLGDRADYEAGRDTSGPVTDGTTTRSEERLRVGTETVETGRARLRKYIVTEQVTTTVPVSREEVRIVREPITDANRDAALAGGDLTEEQHEVILHAERPVVQKETVAVERVRLATETVTEEQQVTGEVRKEQIEVASDDDAMGSGLGR